MIMMANLVKQLSIQMAYVIAPDYNTGRCRRDWRLLERVRGILQMADVRMREM